LLADDWNFSPPREDKALVAYGDLNCPFCYALEERLTRRDVDIHIEWRLVEHAPELPVLEADSTEAEQRELTDELAALLTRAPDVPISKPPFRPASGPAIRAVLAAAAVDALCGDRLRLALYRALWQEGRNIASSEVIHAVAQECGITAPLLGSPFAAQASAWTAEWRASQFNRIPCLVSSVDARLLGLSTEDRLDLFLRSGLFGSRTEDACGPS